MVIRKKEYRTTIIFHLKDKPGALCNALLSFKKYSVNLTKIISRPHSKIEWEYLFFIEIEGSIKDNHVKKALKDLKKHTLSTDIWGSFKLRKV